ncbi:MAG TPA: UPF0149 family protein [Pseudomonadales bacterium]
MALPDLTALALNAAHQLPVAELHGAVCGLAACHGEDVPIEDVVALLGVDSLTDEAAVREFVSAAAADLAAEDMSFMPLLPEDDVALEDRLEALGQWCASFLAGLAAGLARRGVGTLDSCPDEVKEIVRDFAAIAQVDPLGSTVDPSGSAGDAQGSSERREAAEQDFVELEEFVKVGALLISSTLAEDDADESGDDGEHPAE